MKNQKLLDRKEAAKYLGVSPYTLRAWASTKTRILPFRKVGRKCEYTIEDLENYIKSRMFGKK